MIDSDKRRKIFDQVRTKAEARGTPIDGDPEFLAWVELWIRGEFDISSLRSRYDKLVLHRAQRKREPAASVQEISNSFYPLRRPIKTLLMMLVKTGRLLRAPLIAEEVGSVVVECSGVTPGFN